ncbi:hypothetical protein POM88_040776 [Heracleum sosnowskyi]|uniref:Uncharacterized protein n=1 Tax=Heracleum sosnowskyi TaxID=360622 RepID=A0AAD8HFH3_9APIA|nr:hypothetical protein POM88_040776 [Heracleum sosnowskyi]
MDVQDRRDSPPLWLQLPASATMLRQRSPASSIFENSITLLILVPLLLLLVISSLLSFVSHTSQIFRNNVVKNGWDLLNVVLVLFAILCGVVGKLNDHQTQAVVIHTSSVSDQKTTNKETNIFSIFDEIDFTTNNPPTSQIVHSGLNEAGSGDCNIKVIPVDTCVLRPAQSRPRRSPVSVLPAEQQHEFVNIQAPTLLRPPPIVTTTHQLHTAKRSGAGKDIATTIVSLYKHTKRKTKQMTTKKNQKNSLSWPIKPTIPANAGPALSRTPPPPLPPPSGFYKMYRKVTRPKRIHSEASASPPLPKKVENNYFNDDKSAEFRVFSEVAFEYPEIGNVDQLGGSVLCPSPDVNVKADRFIARLRGEWKLDRMDS